MSTVGGFPGLTSHLTRTVRAPVNPLDLSTIFSIFPKEIREAKNTISPGRFYIPAGTYAKPSVLVIGPSSWWKYIDENQPILEIPQSSIQVADSIVKDWTNGMVGCNMTTSMPGVFWLPGEIKVEELKSNLKYAQALALAKSRQDAYWNALIKYADTFWARTNGSPLCISDEMRIAAKELGLEDNKDWMKDFSQLARVNCIACGTPVRPGYPVCATCGAVTDNEQAKRLGIVFAAK